MQTFLPCEDFTESAKVLDYRRLGKQRVECLQILNTLLGKSGAWRNHPAVRMWRGYEGALAYYGIVICMEWINRGYNDSVSISIDNLIEEYKLNIDEPIPPWIGGPIHSSHRSNLLRKNFEYYSQFGWSEDSTQPYVWPVGKEE